MVVPSWLFDYFRMVWPRSVTKGGRVRAQQLLEAQVASGNMARVEIEGIGEPAYLWHDRLADLERLRAGTRPDYGVSLAVRQSDMGSRTGAYPVWL